MKNAIVLALSLLVIVVALFIFVPDSTERETKTFSDMTELYSRFTQYMKAHVNYHLLAVDCEPDEYYYNKSICFVCKEYDACFDYASVDKGGEGILINPAGNYYLSGNYNVEEEASFNSLGLSKTLGCGLDGEITDCVEGVTLSFEGKRMIFTFPEGVNKTQKIGDIFEAIGMKCEFSTIENTDITVFSCENIGGRISGNEVII
jgi:hypothetical protein